MGTAKVASGRISGKFAPFGFNALVGLLEMQAICNHH
jgi:hypothetical protein